MGSLHPGVVVGTEDDGAHGHLPGSAGGGGESKGAIHGGAVARLDQTSAHPASLPESEISSKCDLLHVQCGKP